MPLLRPIAILSASLAFAALVIVRPTMAQTPTVFVIAASEGYGVGDCLAEGGSCGQVIADAWCTAHGATHAISFGLAKGSDAAAELATAQASPGSLVISCGQ